MLRIAAIVACAVAILALPAAGFPAGGEQATLTVTVSAGGTVSSSPDGIAGCTASTCSAPFDTGSDVTLTATPGSGYVFAGWTGCTSESDGSCTVAMPADGTEPEPVTATFTPLVALTVTESGTGTGSVTRDPAGTDCDSGCTAWFQPGTPVTLTATPADGSVFSGWSGACSGSDPSCALTLGAPTSVDATFDKLPVLTVTTTGSGAGTVTVGQAGTCSGQCSYPFASGTQVTLTAAAAEGSTFAGWSGGACSGSDASCTVTIAADTPVGAEFDAPVRPALAVSLGGSGSGTVTSDRGGIACGTSCSAAFDTTTQVTLTATPAAGSTFAGWTGDCSGAATTCTLTVSDAASVVATFTAAAKPTLTVSRTGSGSGRVTSSPAGIDCGTSCSAAFDAGTTVTLTAVAATGSSFTGWSGACSSTYPTCMVSVSASTSVTATFAPLAVLTVLKSGLGTGTVTSAPTGISCGSGCSASFPTGTSVTLSAFPSVGSTFAGWSGACTGTSSTCTVSLDVAKTVTAAFATSAPPAAPVDVTVTATGSGTVTSAPTGISCGSTCSASFTASPTAQVVLTETPAAGWTFGGWGGACSGTAATCALPLTTDASVSATFVAPVTPPATPAGTAKTTVATLRRVTVATAANGRHTVHVQVDATVASSVQASVAKGESVLARALVQLEPGAWKFSLALPAKATGALTLKLVATDADKNATTLTKTVQAVPVATVKKVSLSRRTILLRLQVASAATARTTAKAATKQVAVKSVRLARGARIVRLALPKSVHGAVRVAVALQDAAGNTQTIQRTVKAP